MKSIFSLLLALALTAPAFATPTNGDDPMIEVGAEQEVELGENTILFTNGFTASPEKHTVEVIDKEVDANGNESPTVVVVTDKETGKKTIVGLGDDPFMARMRLNMALRIRIPEFFGFRMAVEYDQLIEMGFDLGFGLFFNNAGLYLNVYPFAHTGAGGFYVGGRIQKESIFAILATATGTRVEAVVGYRHNFPKKKTFVFIELGYSRMIGNMVTQGFGITSSSDAPLAIPSKEIRIPSGAIGFGWYFGRHTD